MPEAKAKEQYLDFSFRDLVQMILVNWYWLLISVTVCLGCGVLYLLHTPKIYSRTATILIKDSRKGGDSDLASLSDLAGMGMRKSVDNEIYILRSRRLMTEVVRQLGLTVNYTTKRGLRTVDLYGQNPVDISFPNADERHGFSFEIDFLPDERMKLSGFERYAGAKETFENEIVVSPGDTVHSPVGDLVLQPTPYMIPRPETTIRVTKVGLV